MRPHQQTLAGRKLAVLTVLLGGFTAFGPLSMDLYLPAFPALAADLGASQAAVQLTLTADVIGLVVGQLILGPISDARGRRALLIGSTLVCAVASVAGSASAVLGALMFAGGIAVTPLMALGGEGTALPMVAVVAGGALAAVLATALLTRRPDPSTLLGDTRP